MKMILLIFFLLPIVSTAQAADVNATWDPVTLDEQGGPENVSHYMLYWGQTSRPGNVVHPEDPTFSYDQDQNVGNTTSSRQSGFTPGQTYYFSVAAVDIGGNTSVYSAEVTVVIPSDQDGGIDAGTDAGTDAGGQDAGADEATGDPGGEEETVIEGGCGCGWETPSGSGSGSILWLLGLLALPFFRRKRERY
jgi:MYXO-CTERM domain-containing protein